MSCLVQDDAIGRELGSRLLRCLSFMFRLWSNLSVNVSWSNCLSVVQLASFLRIRIFWGQLCPGSVGSSFLGWFFGNISHSRSCRMSHFGFQEDCAVGMEIWRCTLREKFLTWHQGRKTSVQSDEIPVNNEEKPVSKAYVVCWWSKCM